MLVLYLTSWEIFILFNTVAVWICIPINSAYKVCVLFSVSAGVIIFYNILTDAISMDLDLHFPNFFKKIFLHIYWLFIFLLIIGYWNLLLFMDLFIYSFSVSSLEIFSVAPVHLLLMTLSSLFKISVIILNCHNLRHRKKSMCFWERIFYLKYTIYCAYFCMHFINIFNIHFTFTFPFVPHL